MSFGRPGFGSVAGPIRSRLDERSHDRGGRGPGRLAERGDHPRHRRVDRPALAGEDEILDWENAKQKIFEDLQ